MSLSTRRRHRVIANEPERAAIVERTVGAALLHRVSALGSRKRLYRNASPEADHVGEGRASGGPLQRMLFRFVDVDLHQALRLSERLGLYAYDAYVLACAQRMRCPVLTLDKRLAASAPLAGVEVLEVGT